MKRQAEYCGLCWHEELYRGRRQPGYAFHIECSCGMKWYDDISFCPENPDFTTGNGFEILSAAITAKGEYLDFYTHYWSYVSDQTEWWLAIAEFHEKPSAEKSRIFGEYLRGDV